MSECYIGFGGRVVGNVMPAPYPRCFCAGFAIPRKFTIWPTRVLSREVVQTGVVLRAIQQTERLVERAEFTVPVMWEMVAALIGTFGPSDMGRPCGDLVQ